jgi:predicted dehydrogenase
MSELQFGLIGTGFWAHYQLSAWGEVAGVRCVAVCDRDQRKAGQFASRFGIERVFADAETMLAETRFDFVDVVTSPQTHEAVVELCAKHATPVICQKPLAESLDAAERMARLCLDAGIPLLVHENFRWQRPLRELKRVLESGIIGRPSRARVSFCSSFPVFDNQPYLKQLGRFILADVGVHILDVVRFLFGEATSLYCQTQQVNPEIKGEDVATVTLEMADEMTVVAEMSYASRTEYERFPETFVFVEGDCGSVELAPTHWIRTTTAAGTTAQQFPPTKYDWADPAYLVVHSSMVACERNLLQGITDAGRAETNAADNLKTLRLVFASYDSAASNSVSEVQA